MPEQEKRQLLYTARHASAETRALIEAGRLAEGEAEIKARMTRLEARKRADTPAWATDAEMLAEIMAFTKRAKEGEPLARRAVAIREAGGDPAAHGKALIVLTETLLQGLESRAAELIARRTILLVTPLESRKDLLARAYSQLGDSLAKQGWPGEALPYAEKALEIARTVPGDSRQLLVAIDTDRKGTQSYVDSSTRTVATIRTELALLAKAETPDNLEMAKSLGYLSRTLGTLGRYDEAIAAGRETLAIRQKIEGTKGSEPIDTRIAQSEIGKLSIRKTVWEATRDGVTFGETMREGPATAAALPAKAAREYAPSEIEALIEGSRFAEAETILRERLAGHKAAGQANSAAAAVDIELLGQTLSSTSRVSEAVDILRDLVALRDREGDPVAAARAYWRLAYALNGASDYRAAETAARRAIAIATPLTDQKVPLAAAYGELGASLAGQRRRPEAGIAFQKSVDIAIEKQADPVLLADYHNSLALNLQQMGNVEEAERIFRSNLDAIVAAKRRGHIDTARTLSLLANNLSRQQKMEETELASVETIAIRERALGTRHPLTIGAMANYVGQLAKVQRNAEALELQERVMKLRASLPETTVAGRVMDIGLMGEILANRKQLDEAIAYRRRALALAKDKLEPTDASVQIATRELAFALLAKNDKDPEPVTLMRGAVAAVRRERLRNLFGRGLGRASASERSFSTALSDTGKLNQGAVDMYRSAIGVNGDYATDNRSEEPRLRAESFEIAQDLATTEAGRAFAAIAVRESLGDSPRGRLVRRQQDLAAQLRAKNNELIAAANSAPGAAQKIRGEIEALSTDLAKADAALRRGFPDYVRLIAPDALSAAEVRKRLKPGEGLLLIVKINYYTLSFAITRDGFDWSASQTMLGQDRTSINRVRCDVDALTCPPGMTQSPVFDRVTSHEIYKQLIQPLDSALKDVKTLYVTTTGDLADLPFAALITEKPQGPDSEEALLTAPWLSDRFALVSLPSVSALRAVATKRKAVAQAAPFVGYGAPVLAAPGKARAIPAGFAPSPAAAQGLADPAKLSKLPSLPGTEVELKAMANVLGATGDAVRLGPNATEAAVRADPRIGKARIVAFATHGLLPGELEGFAEPGLVFTPPAQPSADDDGVLSASEVAAMRMAADWVILSACNTATAEGGGGSDALSALAQAFLHAGADALLASRWRVGDAVTAALTVETLANARASPAAGRAAALQAAMRAIRTGKRADGSAVPGWTIAWAHPMSWAPFSLIADGN